MEHTYEELKKKTVAQLREIASELEHEAVKGYTQLNKEHLLVAICKAFDIETHQHHEVVGINKAEIKAQIRALKLKRDQALEARDKEQHKYILRLIHRLKRKIHKATI
jgi:DNA-binding IclR family transcriptional regulator